MSDESVLSTFEGYGIEIEYMIVDEETLSVKPLADQLLKLVGGGYESEVELGTLAWSNELVLHVVELKTNGPVATLTGLEATFQQHITKINGLLQPLGGKLLPTAMHPWMDPNHETHLWPHEHNAIYETFDRIFDCRGHGWANLQSTHINLPFGNDEEFGRLHAAIRLVLPLLPALAASSPYMEGQRGPGLDTRVEMYRQNARRIPSVTGHVVPEAVFTREAYEHQILQRIYDDLAPSDPDGILQHEWVNARGCIARFDRQAIEIRLLDVQESPVADVAIAAAVIETVRALFEGIWSGFKEQKRWHEMELAGLLSDATRDGDHTVVKNEKFLKTFGYPERGRARLNELWQHLIENVVPDASGSGTWRPALNTIVTEGCLARRLTKTLGTTPSGDELKQAYEQLAHCLADGMLFHAT